MPATQSSAPQDATSLVVGAVDYYRTLSDSWIYQTTVALNDLSSVHVNPITFNTDYNIDQFLPAFVPPTVPSAPAFNTVTPKTVATPTLNPVTLRSLGNAPAAPDFSTLTQYVQPPVPNAPMPVQPAYVPPQLDVITVPAAPIEILPDAPSLFILDLPAPPVVVIPPFTGVRPRFDLSMPTDGALAWSELAYSSTLKDAINTQLQSMIAGSLGLPLNVEQAIMDRGRAREDRSSRKLIMEASEEMSARGMTEPNGILAQRLLRARQANRDAVNGLNRDLLISTKQMAVEGMKFAIQQGLALEQLTVQINQQMNERALKAAIYARDYSIQRLNAQIAYVNLQEQAYSVDAQIWKSQIEGAVAALAVYRELIEARRLIGEINKDMVLRYKAQLEGVHLITELYKTKIEAAKVTSEINVQRVEAAKLVLQGFSTQVDAWGKLQDGYRAQVEGALGVTKYAESLANVYARRMEGYKIQGDAFFNEGRFAMEINTQTIENFKAALAGSEQDLRGQIATLDGQLRGFDANVKLYEAKGSIASAQSAAIDRTTQLHIESERNRTNVVLEQAKVQIEQALKIGEILVEQIKAKAAALAQLAASSQSAVHYQAQVAQQNTGHFGINQNYNYSGGTTDRNP